VVNAARAEEGRKRAVTELVATAVQRNPCPQWIDVCESIGRQAIEGKWPLERAELEILRASRPQGPFLAVRHEPELTDTVIEAAVCKNAGLAEREDYFEEKVLEAADRRFPRGMSLCDLVMTYARKGGYSGHSVKANPEAAMRAARRANEIQAIGSWGPSTGGASLGGLLANVANKFLRAGFMAVETAWRQIAAIRPANDFKQITTYSLTGDLTFQLVPPGGEIKHGQVDATSYTNQVQTYARMLGLDRRDIINDDLGAFASVSRRLGRGGGIALNKLFWGIFLNNSSFFTAGRNNLITGAGSTLQLSQLDALNQKFLLQTDPDGNILGIAAAILLVPPALAVTAQTLMSSTMVVSGATTAPGTPNNNPWAGKFRVVSSAYMQDSTLTGNSATAWYLLADPNDLPVIEVAFLNGVETPTVESSDADFGMLGQAFRGYFDVGVSPQEYRAGAKSAGA
jgi:phage major head subunit gpT-like protein